MNAAEIRSVIKSEMGAFRKAVLAEIRVITQATTEARMTEKEAASYSKMSTSKLKRLRQESKLPFKFRDVKVVNRKGGCFSQYSGVTYSKTDLDKLNIEV